MIKQKSKGMDWTERLSGERWWGTTLDTAIKDCGNEGKAERGVNWEAGIEIDNVKSIKFNTHVVGAEEAGRTICRTEGSMVVVMCYSNKAYRHQGIENANRNYPADWIDVGSIALQESLPLSKVESWN